MKSIGGRSLIKRFTFLLFCIVFLSILFVGCARTAPANTKDPENNPFVYTVGGAKTNITKLPQLGRGFFWGCAPYGTADAGLKEGLFPAPDTLPDELTYTGDPIRFDFCIAPEDNGRDYELGMQIWFNGVQQPFSVGEATGIVPCDEVTEYRFDAYGDKGYAIPVTFTPVCGKAGETATMYITMTYMPSYVPKDEDDLAPRVWMHNSTFQIHTIEMKADAPEQRENDSILLDSGAAVDPADGVKPGVDLSIWPKDMAEYVAQHPLWFENEEDMADTDQFFSAAGVPYLYPNKDNTLEVVAFAASDCAVPCYLQIRIDGKPAPVFDGKYFAKTVMPKTKGQECLFPLQIDLNDYPDAHTVQYVCIIIPSPEMEGGAGVRVSNVGWIRRSGE